MNPLVLEIEELAFRAWPAEEVVDLEGWRLRFAHGVTRRANSVWPNAWRGDTPVQSRITAVEAFAAARGIPPSFQLTPAAKPPDLDGQLAASGYEIDAPVAVETVPVEGFRMAGQPPQIATSVLASPSDEWLDLAVDRGRFAGMREPYCGILSRVGDGAGFALARWKGKPVAIGLGVIEGPWLGVFNMATLAEARRRRAATAILGALVGWGVARGATRVYLQVERDNAPARALYTAAGFTPEYEYHYRTKFAPG